MKRSGGFTLLEVVVALLVVALGLAAAVQLTTLAASNLVTLQRKTLADWVAMNRLAALRTAASLPAAGSRQGHEDMAGTRFYWREEVTGGPLPQVRAVSIAVGEHAGGPALVTIHSDLADALVPESSGLSAGSGGTGSP